MGAVGPLQAHEREDVLVLEQVRELLDESVAETQVEYVTPLPYKPPKLEQKLRQEVDPVFPVLEKL